MVFAINGVIVTSVNTYTSMMWFSTEDKYLMKCLRENKKYGAKQFLKMFPNKKWSLVDWKRWSKKLKTQILLSTYWVVVNLALSARCLCYQSFYQHFQSTKTPVFVRKHFKQSLCSMFFIFSQRFDQVLANSHHWRIGINWRHNYVINSREYVTNRWTIFKHL